MRIGLWLYDPLAKAIVFSDGFGIMPQRQSYPVGVGMIGKCFADNRSINEADVRVVPSYEPSRAGDPPYRAVLCEPVRYTSEPIGALTADRSTVGAFDDVSVALVRALAAQCALAVTTYERFEEAPASEILYLALRTRARA